jgi:alkylation response protein AidB-like acyl-CoA dehydrogenase
MATYVLKKDYALTEDTMRKAGDLGFLSVAVPEAYGGMGMGFVNTVLVCDYIGSNGSFSTALERIHRNWNIPIIIRNRRTKNKYVPKLASGEWFGACASLNQVQDQMPIQENKSCLSEDGKTYSITGQKNGFRMQDSL